MLSFLWFFHLHLLIFLNLLLLVLLWFLLFHKVNHMLHSLPLLLLNLERIDIHPYRVAFAARLLQIGLVVVSTTASPSFVHDLLVGCCGEFVA